ncbi:hypothetical protein [Acidocella facilis]|uniref:hypothetical protein n=1 Tax=Acidocella facilis TaxID=525 RepID=UPI001F396FAA|nr:hypothetical protein [Acidocella facilis]
MKQKGTKVRSPAPVLGPGAGDLRIASARQEIVRILTEEAPGTLLGEGPLERLAIYVSGLSRRDWLQLEDGYPEVEARLSVIERKAQELLREIDRAQIGEDALRVPGGGAFLILKMRAAIQPVRDLADQIRREKDGLPQGEGRLAWKGWAWTFYDLVIQTWLEGGEPFWRDQQGEQRNFGIHPEGKATLVVRRLLEMVMKSRPNPKPPSAETISDFLAMLPDPGPWPYEPTGKDLEAHLRGDWAYDGGHRIKLDKSQLKRNTSENFEKKKRGRPRGK